MFKGGGSACVSEERERAFVPGRAQLGDCITCQQEALADCAALHECTYQTEGIDPARASEGNVKGIAVL